MNCRDAKCPHPSFCVMCEPWIYVHFRFDIFHQHSCEHIYELFIAQFIYLYLYNFNVVLEIQCEFQC